MGTSFAATLISTKDIPPEQLLWRGVLCNALEDTMCNMNDRKASVFKMEAHQWIIEKDNDFERVCYWSGFDPDHVKERYVAAIKNGDIKFTHKQVAWNKYYIQYQKYRNCSEPESKKYHRLRLESLRKAVYDATTHLISSFISTAQA